MNKILFLFEAQLSRFVRQLDGLQPLRYLANESEQTSTIQQIGSSSTIIFPLAETINNAISFYLDTNLHENWALLICLILHPGCSGYPASKGNPWPCLRGRFQHIWCKDHGEFVSMKHQSMKQ